jgi:hypothetical protein
MHRTVAFTITRYAPFGATTFPRRTRANGVAIAAISKSVIYLTVLNYFLIGQYRLITS